MWVVEIVGWEGGGCAVLNCNETGTWKEEMLCKKWSLKCTDRICCKDLGECLLRVNVNGKMECGQ